jgi:hypothetical protein
VNEDFTEKREEEHVGRGPTSPVSKTVLVLQNHLSGNTGCGRESFSASQMNPATANTSRIALPRMSIRGHVSLPENPAIIQTRVAEKKQSPTVNIAPARGRHPALDHKEDDASPNDSGDDRNPKRDISLRTENQEH